MARNCLLDRGTEVSEKRTIAPVRGRYKSMLIALFLLSSMLSVLLVIGSDSVKALPSDSWIVGKVTSDGVTPVPNSYVKIMFSVSNGPSEGINYTWTDTAGDYSIGVPGGFEYSIFVVNGSYYLPFDSVRVMPGETVYKNFTLVSISPYSTDVTIKGYVKNETGAPMSAGHVIGLIYDPAIRQNGPPRYGNITSPDVSGYYQMNIIAGIAGGGATGLDFAGYPGMTDNTTSDPLVNGTTYWFNLTLTKKTYNDDAMVHGHVYDSSNGLSIQSALVSIQVQNSFTPPGEGYTNYTFTNATGHYEMNVVNGSFRLTISKLAYSMNITEASILFGGNITVDATLVPTNATVRGNVTDKSTGKPLNFARVIQMDAGGNLTMATTNSTGAYDLLALVGDNMTIFAEMNGYARNFTKVSLTDGGIAWIDFALTPVSAWLVGQVTDFFTGAPISGVDVHASSTLYSDSDQTNSTGCYNISLIPGDYDVSFEGAAGYDRHSSSVTVIDLIVNYLNVSLVPSTLPMTTLFHGWVNSTSTGLPIQNADVAAYRNNMNYQNRTTTNSTGYFEMYVPPMAFDAYARANDYDVDFVAVNASGKSNVSAEFQLGNDTRSPNTTLWQAPVENISAHNPMAIHATVEESHLRWAGLMTSVYWNTSGTKINYLYLGSIGFSNDPLDGSSGLNYSLAGDNYTMDAGWDCTLKGGMLVNASVTSSPYIPFMEIDSGIQHYIGLRGYFENATISPALNGTAFFDMSTGDFLTFVFDGPSRPNVLPSDASALFSPRETMMEFSTGGWPWFSMNDTVRIGAWHLASLRFVPNYTVPSGDYRTTLIVNDWGGHYATNTTNLTVDTLPPHADAGLDLAGSVGIPVAFDGSLSSDNIGIVNYTWTFVYNGSTVFLYGQNPTFTFFVVGHYDVTLLVTDAAGNNDTDVIGVDVSPVIPEPPIYLLAGLMTIAFLVAARGKRKEHA